MAENDVKDFDWFKHLVTKIAKTIDPSTIFYISVRRQHPEIVTNITVTLSNFSDNFPSSFKLSNFSQNFPTAAKLSNFSETFQLQKKLSNFARFFPTSLGSFQLKQKLSNFRLSNLKLSNFSFFPTALSNYTYPHQGGYAHIAWWVAHWGVYHW